MAAHGQLGEADRLRRTHRAKVEAELADVTPEGIPVRWRGDPLARIALVKGVPSRADLDAGEVMAGPDGEAADRALAALGFDTASVFRTCSRPSAGAPDSEGAERLRVQLEAVDPAAVVALDGKAADDVGRAFGSTPLRPGRPVRHHGRLLLAVEGFEASLADEDRKRRVWTQLKRLVESREG